MIVMWGLGNCDTCRRARHWLEARGIAFEFRDVRAQAPEGVRLSRWLSVTGAGTLINRRSTTWRGLAEAAKRQIESGDILSVLEQHPALMKRPILEHGKQVLVGFDTAAYAAMTGKTG